MAGGQSHAAPKRPVKMRASPRVVITGLGVVSSVGIGVNAFLEGMLAGRQGVRPITSFDTMGFPYSNGCEVAGFEPADWVRRHELNEIGKASQFAIAAARMAVADANLPEESLRQRAGLVAVGTTDGESRDLDELTLRQLHQSPDAMDKELAQRVPAGRLSSSVARELGLVEVESVTLATACAAGNYAIGYGADALRGEDVDFALVGGADAVCRKTFAGFYRVGTIASNRCCPFDKDRDGILTGEGSGMIVLERRDDAIARGARIYAEVLGYGLNCDADHPVAPNRDSFAHCMALAQQDAVVSPADVGFISAHGTGTKANDTSEAAAIRQIFGEEPPPTVSIKSMLGHAMGAASALSAIACSLSLAHGFIPPTMNHKNTDPECDLDVVPNQARRAELNVVQNNALAFGGNNAVLLLGRG